MKKQKKILILRSIYSPIDEKNLHLLTKTPEIELGYYKDLVIDFMSHPKKTSVSINNVPLESYKLVYMRTWKKRHLLTRSLAQYLQHHKVILIDTESLNATHGDKLMQYMMFYTHKLPFPKTLYIPRESMLKKIELIKKAFKTPFIMKATFSSKGKDNYLIRDFDSVEKILTKHDEDEDFLFQEYIPNDFDYRLYVFGYKTVVAYKRTRSKRSRTHLNNLSQGAEGEEVPLKNIKKLCVLAEKIARISRIEVCGVDIVENKYTRKPYLFEINIVPGLSQTTAQMHLKKYLLSLVK